MPGFATVEGDADGLGLLPEDSAEGDPVPLGDGDKEGSGNGGVMLAVGLGLVVEDPAVRGDGGTSARSGGGLMSRAKASAPVTKPAPNKSEISQVDHFLDLEPFGVAFCGASFRGTPARREFLPLAEGFFGFESERRCLF